MAHVYDSIEPSTFRIEYICGTVSVSIVVAYSIILYTFLLHRHFQFNGLDVQYLVVASPVHGDVPSLTTGNLSGQIIITLNLNGLVFWYLGDSFYETTRPYLGEFPTNNFPKNPSTREMVSNHC